MLVCQVIQFLAGEPCRIVLWEAFLGSSRKHKGKWRQWSGDEFSLELFKGLVVLVDDLPS
jgi:hypothetical protein